MPYSTAQPAYKPFDIGERVKSDSRREYLIEKVLQDKEMSFGRVYLATHGTSKYVVKEIPQDVEIRAGIYRRVGSHPHVRALIDTILDRRTFVFRYLDHNLLDFAQRDLPTSVMKRILKCALQGLAALHEQDLVHNDIKANNIMIQARDGTSGIEIEQVELVDLEDTAYLPPPKAVVGFQAGNWMWRSPEAHAQGPLAKPSDMFSFGIVCIYAITQCVIFAVDESELPEDVPKLSVVLTRQVSYFADEDSLDALLDWLGPENTWCKIFQKIKGSFGKDHPWQPFSLWQGEGIDDDFRSFVCGLTNFDPLKRLTAQQALAHRWLEEV